jgi:hypothetical protein
MASKTLFQTLVGRLLPGTDARNEAGGPAHARPDGLCRRSLGGNRLEWVSSRGVFWVSKNAR